MSCVRLANHAQMYILEKRKKQCSITDLYAVDRRIPIKTIIEVSTLGDGLFELGIIDNTTSDSVNDNEAGGRYFIYILQRLT